MNGIVATLLTAVVLATAPPALAPVVDAWQGQGQGRRIDSTYGCVACHADKRRAFLEGVHVESGIQCHDCHGGDPTAFEIPEGHAGRFIGQPDKWATIRICAECHADPDQMRQYGLPADQLAELRTSRHGQLLLEDLNSDAPTCTDCHDAHTIRKPEDARSKVHPTNIPATCASCHDDEQLMSKYDLPTDQHELFMGGAHGIGLFEERNFASPTCIGCHGSHAALPARMTEIVNVCGDCHVLVARAFNQGPHGAASVTKEFSGCLACHANHGAQRILPENTAAKCSSCHENGDEAAAIGERLQELLVDATEDLRKAEEAIAEMVSMGHDVTDARIRYRTALTNYRQLAPVQHGFDMDRLLDLSLRVGSVSQDLQTAAEVRAEVRWEHKLFLIPVWFLALSALVLGLFKLRDIRHGP